MYTHNVKRILEYSNKRDWTHYIGGLQFPHFFLGFGSLVMLLGANSFYEEDLMRKHLLYKKFGRIHEAEIIGMEECVLEAGNGRQFFAVLSLEINSKYYETKISTSKDDYLGRKIEVIKWGVGSVCVVRRNHEELYAMECFNNNHDEKWQDFIWKGVVRGTLGMVFITALMGLKFIPKGIALYLICVVIIYLIYPVNFYIRRLFWKTKLTYR